MAKNDSIKKTLTVAFALCIVCSVVVSTAAVVLRPTQQQNEEIDRMSNILQVADLLQPGIGIDEQFEDSVTARVVNLETGEYAEDKDPVTYNQFEAASDPAQSRTLSGEQDLAGIGRQENYATVYLVGDPDDPEQIIVPVRGQGLWSLMSGYLALEGDANTVAGLSFYDHGETPGLGGEIDNPDWKAQWEGKKIYPEDSMDPAIRVVKGNVGEQTPEAEYKVDGLSGATLTSNGVTNLMQFWLSDSGFAEYLARFRDTTRGA